MHVTEIFQRRETVFSFEFFPPRTPEAAEQLFAAIRQLEPLGPDFVSVTYGAGGATRELTHDLVVRIKETTKLDPIPHLTCIGHSEAEVERILERYARAGVGNILALAGDPPADQRDYDRSRDAFRHAADLVRFIRKFNERHTGQGGENFRGRGEKSARGLGEANFRGRGLGIGVAGFPEGHPATANRLLEMDYLKAKVDAGADYICTQLFFDNRDFYDFVDRCQIAGIHVPIIAGIMPVMSISGMRRMADLAAGSRFPAALLRAIGRAGNDPEAVKRVGVHWATEQCRDLLDHKARGIHFYTLNKSDATRQIYMSLGILK